MFSRDYFKIESSNGQFIVNSKTGVILDSQWDLDEPHNITKFDISSLNSACISWSDEQKTIELDSVDILCIGYYHQVPTALSNYEPKVEDPDLCQHKFIWHVDHKPNEYTDSFNADCICPDCTELEWDQPCVNCNLLARDCYGQEHGEGEDILNTSGKQIHDFCCDWCTANSN